ncbi:MAG TPA: hypothetical protein VFG19_11860 [Geobacteraceae bacterium]|nr:hypothetical protein [Geobacteraceae bacterium]
MAISVVKDSVSMKIQDPRPQVLKPVVFGDQMAFRCTSPLSLTGECQIKGERDDDPDGVTLGMIQLQWVETSWAIYRGQNNTDGSCFLQRARPPARPVQGCRDTRLADEIFFNGPNCTSSVAAANQPFPVKMTAVFEDSPSSYYPLMRVNSQTGKENYLWEVQLEFHFCTVLSLQFPNVESYKHLKHLLWSLHWQARFKPTNFSNLRAQWDIKPASDAGANDARVSDVYDGGPTEKKFTNILVASHIKNCLALAQDAAKAPNSRESRIWEDFDVRH